MKSLRKSFLKYRLVSGVVFVLIVNLLFFPWISYVRASWVCMTDLTSYSTQASCQGNCTGVCLESDTYYCLASNSSNVTGSNDFLVCESEYVCPVKNGSACDANHECYEYVAPKIIKTSKNSYDCKSISIKDFEPLNPNSLTRNVSNWIKEGYVLLKTNPNGNVVMTLQYPTIVGVDINIFVDPETGEEIPEPDYIYIQEQLPYALPSGSNIIYKSFDLKTTLYFCKKVSTTTYTCPEGYTLLKKAKNYTCQKAYSCKLEYYCPSSTGSQCFKPGNPENYETTSADLSYYKNDSSWTKNGTCLGSVYIFSGRPVTCKMPGVDTGFQDCCDVSFPESSIGQVFNIGGDVVGASLGLLGYSTAGAAILIGKLAYNFLFHCRKTDDKTYIALALNKYPKRRVCVYVGQYCSKHLRIGPLKKCVQKKKVYCCFPTVLARIIQEQGRPQLKSFKSLCDAGNCFGTPTNPVCRGFTPQEFQMIDFSKIDFSDWYDVEESTLKEEVNKAVNNVNTNINMGLPENGTVVNATEFENE